MGRTTGWRHGTCQMEFSTMALAQHLGRSWDAHSPRALEITPRMGVALRSSFTERLAASKAPSTAGATTERGVLFGDVRSALVGSDSQTGAFDERTLRCGRVED